MRLVDGTARERADEGVVPHLVAKPGHHGSDLRIEDWRGHSAKQVQEDFDVLPGGVEHLDHGRVGEQGRERCQIQPSRLRIDDGHVVRTAKLHNAQLWVVGAFTHELGVDGDERLGGQAGAQGGERVGGGDQDRGGEAGRVLGHGVA